MAADQRPNPAAIRARARGSVSASWPPSEPRGQPPLPLLLLAWAITMSRQARSPSAAAEVGLLLVAGDGVGLVVDDRLHEFVLVREVVVQLRSADLRRCPDVLERGAGDTPLVDQPGGRLDDPGPGALPLGGQPRLVTCVAAHGHDSRFWV